MNAKEVNWNGIVRVSARICFFTILCAGSADGSDYDFGSAESEARLIGDIKYLASDSLEGRGVGTDGLNQAADYIRQEFERAGLDVTTADGDGFQRFPMIISTELGEPNELAFRGPDNSVIDLTYDADVRTCSFGASGTFQAEIVFAGYGIKSTDPAYDDFADVDVEGKAVIIVRRVPRQGMKNSPFSGRNGALSRHANLSTKISNAVDAGAAAILLVNDPHTSKRSAANLRGQVGKAAAAVSQAAKQVAEVDATEQDKVKAALKQLHDAVAQLEQRKQALTELNPDTLIRFGDSRGIKEAAVPVFHLSQAACDQLLQQSLGKSLDEVETEIDKDLQPRSVVLADWKAEGAASIFRNRGEMKNVIGVLEGHGEFADETIVIGAHYDHVGRGGRGSLSRGSTDIHNGADDNASGTACLLELARRFASREQPLARRLVFIAFTAEERGLIGSKHYVKEPVFPLEDTIAMFNIDMIGRLRNERLTIFGMGTSPHWQQSIVSLGDALNLSLDLRSQGFGPSDHSSFYEKQIPVLHFFTGTHSDYHRPTDDWQKINSDGMLRIASLVEGAVAEMIEVPKRPEYRAIQQRARVSRSGSRTFFGSIPDFSSDEPGYIVLGTAPGSLAEKAGLRKGDRILRLGESEISQLNEFERAFSQLKAGKEFTIVVQRGTEQISLIAVLANPK